MGHFQGHAQPLLFNAAEPSFGCQCDITLDTHRIKLTRVLCLHAVACRLSFVPPCICGLPGLTALDMSDNDLADVPPALSALTGKALACCQFTYTFLGLLCCVRLSFNPPASTGWPDRNGLLQPCLSCRHSRNFLDVGAHVYATSTHEHSGCPWLTSCHSAHCTPRGGGCIRAVTPHKRTP